MLQVAKCESSDNPTAQDPSSTAFGLFQELGETSTDPVQQVLDAYALWVQQGMGAWAASQPCWA